MKEGYETTLRVEEGNASCPVCPAQAVIWLCSPSTIRRAYRTLRSWLDGLAPVLPPLLLRLIVAYEFAESGIVKWQGENWFADLVFPFPFNVLSAETNWELVTGFETFGALALLLGFITRFVSFGFLVITLVAIATVHWPSGWSSLSDLLAGYTITDHGHGNYKLPVLYLVMLMPLLFGGAGRLSIDAWFERRNRSGVS